MKKNKRPEQGFTLVELMIVVAIIGLLAAMAIPNYLRFTTKAKQVEAKTNLAGIFTAEEAYLTEYGIYSAVFNQIPWGPTGKPKYTYDIGDITTVGAPVTAAPQNAAAPGAYQGGFTALAYGNVDNDLTVDTWQMNDLKLITNTMDDARD